MRDRHLVRFETNVLDRITIDAAGKNKTVLARKNENWTIANRNNQPANADEVNRLIETLKNEQVTKFVADVASELGKYGLDKPQLQLTLSSFASENTAETKSGEQPFATIAFGKTEGEDVYARLGDEPFIVAVKRNLLDKIFVDPLQWQDVVIFRFKPEQVHRLSVVTDREQSITRGPKNEWKWVTGSGPINQVNVQSLLNTLTSLHAVRWVGATTAAHGFEKPQIAITFTTSPDDKSMHKLLIGAPNGEGMWFGKTDERDGTFVISNPDFNALKLPIANPPAPSPKPSAALSPAPSPVATPIPLPLVRRFDFCFSGVMTVRRMRRSQSAVTKRERAPGFCRGIHRHNTASHRMCLGLSETVSFDQSHHFGAARKFLDRRGEIIIRVFFAREQPSQSRQKMMKIKSVRSAKDRSRDGKIQNQHVTARDENTRHFT